MPESQAQKNNQNQLKILCNSIPDENETQSTKYKTILLYFSRLFNCTNIV